MPPSQVLLSLTCLSVVSAARFKQPYFLIMKDQVDDRNLVINTQSCPSGAFTNAPAKLTAFCVSGVWLLSQSVCSEEAARYIVTGKDSCFQLDESNALEVRRFTPLLQKQDDFLGVAYLVPNHFGYFIHLTPDDATEIIPIPEARSHFSVYGINLGILGRYINENLQGAAEGNKMCYATDPSAVIQVFEMKGEGDSIIKSYSDQSHCNVGFENIAESYRLHIGTIKYLNEDKQFNSTFSEINYAEISDLAAPFYPTQVLGQCGSDNVEFEHPLYDNSPLLERPPVYPHMLPPKFSDDIISDEIEETARAYLDYELHGAKLPKVNLTEFQFVKMSTIIVEKYCCHSGMKPRHMQIMLMLFRISASYYFQYYPYMDKSEPGQSQRILEVLTNCTNRTDLTAGDSCVLANMTDSCPKIVSATHINGSDFNFDLPAEIEFELGNLDYVTEAIWKAQLFVHYFCAPFFTDPRDHSAFDTYVEAFFNPLVLKKWLEPRGVYSVYMLLLNGINLKELAEALDSCVFTAREMSEYKNWLTRPAELVSRKKREATSGNHDSCVPPNDPKLFCLEKQFDMFEKKMIHPFEQKSYSSCYNAYSKRQTYKFMHASYYGTNY